MPAQGELSVASIPARPDKSQRSAPPSAGRSAAEPEPEALLALEPYNPTGEFIPDFVANCGRLGVDPHPVILRYAQMQVDAAVAAADDAAAADAVARPLSGRASVGEAADARSPLGSARSSRTAALAPSAAVSQVVARGCEVDQLTVQALALTLRAVSGVQAIRFWRNALSDDSWVALLRAAGASGITDLAIDWNPLESASIVDSLRGIAHLRKLSLRANALGDAFAAEFAPVLASCQSIISVNLSMNEIGDAGAEALAQVLHESKTLFVLSLASNRIGDPGVSALVGALGRTPLPEHISELLTKRQQELEESQKVKTARGSQKKRKMKKDDPLREVDIENVVEEDGVWYAPGNRTLLSLNLSRNAPITPDGVAALVELRRLNQVLARLVFDEEEERSAHSDGHGDEPTTEDPDIADPEQADEASGVAGDGGTAEDEGLDAADGETRPDAGAGGGL